jgi:hypothetical protein
VITRSASPVALFRPATDEKHVEAFRIDKTECTYRCSLVSPVRKRELVLYVPSGVVLRQYDSYVTVLLSPLAVLAVLLPADWLIAS